MSIYSEWIQKSLPLVIQNNISFPVTLKSTQKSNFLNLNFGVNSLHLPESPYWWAQLIIIMFNCFTLNIISRYKTHHGAIISSLTIACWLAIRITLQMITCLYITVTNSQNTHQQLFNNDLGGSSLFVENCPTFID